MTSDEGWIDARFFDVLTNQLVEHSSSRLRWWAFDLAFRQDFLEEFPGFGRVQLFAWRELLPSSLFQSRYHVNTLPRRLPVDFVSLAMLGCELCVIRSLDVHD